MPKPTRAPLRASSQTPRDFELLRVVALVFSDPARAERVVQAFSEAAPEAELVVLGSLADAQAVIHEGPVSVVLGDATLGDGLLTELLQDGAELPLVVLVEEGQARSGVEAVAAGALDWVTRTDVVWDALPHIALGAVREWREFGLRRAAEEQLWHADRLAMVGRVAAAAIHEVGTPLNVVRMRAQLLAMDPSQVGEATSVIVQQCDRIAELLRRTLVLARRRGSREEPVDLAVIAEGARGLLEPSLKRAHVVVSLSAEPAVVRGDGGELLQVVLNLLGNAMDAVGDQGTVDVLVGSDGKLARLSVRDNGTGVPPEALPHLFAPFFTTKEPGRGTGLGLSVSAEIAERHGGRIAVESTWGEGAVFTLELPCYDPDPRGAP